MKRYLNKHIIIVLALGLLFTTSCKQVVIRVDSIPENTPTGQPIFVTGNFNNWDPGEETPREASAELHPYGVWDISINDIPLKVSQGTVRWNQASGLRQ